MQRHARAVKRGVLVGAKLVVRLLPTLRRLEPHRRVTAGQKLLVVEVVVEATKGRDAQADRGDGQSGEDESVEVRLQLAARRVLRLDLENAQKVADVLEVLMPRRVGQALAPERGANTVEENLAKHVQILSLHG
jgi:hypothetical protein